MADMALSKRLTQIMDIVRSKYVQPLTVEHFLTIMLEVLKKEGTTDDELAQVQQVLEANNINPDSMHAYMEGEVQSPTLGDMDRVLYMQRKMLEAKVAAKANGESTLTLPLLLSTILNAPSD